MTAATIENRWDSLYALVAMPKKSDTTPEQRAALEKRVTAGEWLRTGDTAKVLSISRSKVDLMIKAGTINYRNEPGSRYRQCDPKDVLKLLAESRREKRGTSVAALDPSTHVDNDPPEQVSDATSQAATNRRH